MHARAGRRILPPVQGDAGGRGDAAGREADEREAISEIARRLGARLEARPSRLPADGPRTLWHGPGAVVLCVSASRVASELAGCERAREHPAAPRVIAHGERTIALEAVDDAPPDRKSVV